MGRGISATSSPSLSLPQGASFRVRPSNRQIHWTVHRHGLRKVDPQAHTALLRGLHQLNPRVRIVRRNGSQRVAILLHEPRAGQALRPGELRIIGRRTIGLQLARRLILEKFNRQKGSSL